MEIVSDMTTRHYKFVEYGNPTTILLCVDILHYGCLDFVGIGVSKFYNDYGYNESLW